MCVIAYAHSRKLTDAEIETGWENNPDGAGFSWRENGSLRYHKGLMKLDDFKHAYNDCITDHNFRPHVVHFRLATAGGTLPVLCHPFQVCRSSPLALDGTIRKPLLYHNGHIAGWKPLPNLRGPQSDSRVMAAQLIDKQVFDKYVGTILISYPHRRKPYIYQKQTWIEENGVLASNYSLTEPLPRFSWEEWIGNEMTRPKLVLPERNSSRFDSKICSLCFSNKPLRYLHNNTSGTVYRKGVCNDCFLQLLDTVLESDYQDQRMGREPNGSL